MRVGLWGWTDGLYSGYTRGMKTAISVPDEVFELAEQLAEQLGVSRSELYTTALRALLADKRAAEIRASYDAAYGGGMTEEEKAWERAGVASVRKSEWQ